MPAQTIQSEIDAFLAPLRVWLLETLAFLLDHLGDGPLSRLIARELRDDLRLAQYDAKRAIAALAISRFDIPKFKPHHRPPPGCRIRRASHASALRLATRGVFSRMRAGNLRTRIARLKHALDHPEIWIARLHRRWRRGFTAAWRILAAPPVARTHADAPAPALALADTS